MKRITMAVLAVAGLAVAADTARADWGGIRRPAPQAPADAGTGEFNSPNTLSGLAVEHSTKPPDRYGLLPGLRKVFHLGGKDKCEACGGKHSRKDGCPSGRCGPLGHGGYPDPAAGAGQPYPPTMQGTLAFPHHPFVRSPRDYFMTEPGR